MDQVQKAYDELHQLCTSIKHFQENYQNQAIYKSPIIDHFHPEDYSQRGITGFNKFLSHAEAERDYVGAVSDQFLYFKLVDVADYIADTGIWSDHQRLDNQRSSCHCRMG